LSSEFIALKNVPLRSENHEYRFWMGAVLFKIPFASMSVYERWKAINKKAKWAHLHSILPIILAEINLLVATSQMSWPKMAANNDFRTAIKRGGQTTAQRFQHKPPMPGTFNNSSFVLVDKNNIDNTISWIQNIEDIHHIPMQR
jgi:hypothetical protein